MTSTGIRDLKNNLSRYIRQLKPGQKITITEHGRVVAELRSASDASTASVLTGRYAELVATGVIRPAVDAGDPLTDWPTTRQVSLPRGTAARLIDEDRG